MCSNILLDVTGQTGLGLFIADNHARPKNQDTYTTWPHVESIRWFPHNYRLVTTRQCSSPFAAVSLCGVAGLAQTFPSLPVSGPFLPDVPCFQVPSDSVLPLQLWSSSRALRLYLHLQNWSDVFCFMSSFDVPKPFQPSLYHDYQLNPCFLQDLLISPVLQRGHTHCTSHHSHLGGCHDIVIGGKAPN